MSDRKERMTAESSLFPNEDWLGKGEICSHSHINFVTEAGLKFKLLQVLYRFKDTIQLTLK